MTALSAFSPAAAWHNFKNRRGSPAVAAVVVTGAVLAGLLIFLLAGDKPWSGEITKRLTAGRTLKLEHLVTIGLWRGAALAAVLCALALMFQRWWSLPQAPVFPETESPESASARGRNRNRKWIWIFALAAVLLAAWPRTARLDHSLWNDEEVHLRNYVWGVYEPQADGSLAFEPVTWERALFYNKKGNNHQWASIESRLGHILGGGDWGQQSVFNERSVRFFPWLSGLLTVGVVVLLGGAMGNPRAGLAAGIMLALHPWHIRWSVEIRGYSTMMLAMACGLLCLLRALQTNRWRWWAGFSVCQAVFLLCFSGSVYVAAAQNLVALAVIWRGGATGPVRGQAAARLVLAGVWSAVPVALLMMPVIPQTLAYLKEPHGFTDMNRWWYRDLWSHIVTGLRFSGDPPETTAGLALGDLEPWRRWMTLLTAPVLTAAGLFFLLRQDWRTRLITGALLLGGAFSLAHNSFRQTPMMTWYLLFLTIPFVLALAWTAAEISRLNPRRLQFLPLLTAAGFALLTSPALAKMMSVPRQPIREAVQIMRGVSPALQTADANILTASFGAGARQMFSYDPRLNDLRTVEQMEAIEVQAVTEKRPLFLAVRGRVDLAEEEPELTQALERDPRWRLRHHVLGMERMLSYEIYEFVPEPDEDAGTVIRLNREPEKITAPATTAPAAR